MRNSDTSPSRYSGLLSHENKYTERIPDMITEQYRKAILRRLIPQPRKIEFADGFCILKEGLAVKVITAEKLSAEDEAKVRKDLAKFPRFEPVLSMETCPCVQNFGDEEYGLSVQENGITIKSKAFCGVDYALKTLRQLSEPVRGTMTITYEMLPCCVIEDKPALDFRAVHLCIFPETEMTDIIKNLRLAAYHKFNYAIIESWGVFPHQSHPEFAWKTEQKTMEEFQALKDAAKECNIKLIPQFNIFGHATMARVCTAKHAILDENPELASLFEPAGWSFCLSNPETRQVITDLVTELYEFYDHPAYFHLGCDEAYDFQTCTACASADGARLIADHITYFRDFFAEKGARVFIWHDMLFKQGDPRWKNCIVCGDERTENLADLLPKDIIIADWQYNDPPGYAKDYEWATSLYLQEKGFSVAVCPWMSPLGLLPLCVMAAKRKMFGMIETTWHTVNGGAHDVMFLNSAVCAWLGAEPEFMPLPVSQARHIRQISQDMKLTRYEEFGHSAKQILGTHPW